MEKGSFFLSTQPYAGGGEIRVRFENKSVEYIIYERLIRQKSTQLNGNDFRAGVVVKANAVIVSDLVCKHETEKGFSPVAMKIIQRENWDDALNNKAQH